MEDRFINIKVDDLTLQRMLITAKRNHDSLNGIISRWLKRITSVFYLGREIEVQNFNASDLNEIAKCIITLRLNMSAFEVYYGESEVSLHDRIEEEAKSYGLSVETFLSILLKIMTEEAYLRQKKI